MNIRNYGLLICERFLFPFVTVTLYELYGRLPCFDCDTWTGQNIALCVSDPVVKLRDMISVPFFNSLLYIYNNELLSAIIEVAALFQQFCFSRKHCQALASQADSTSCSRSHC
jgi:hypothetical protein